MARWEEAGERRYVSTRTALLVLVAFALVAWLTR